MGVKFQLPHNNLIEHFPALAKDKTGTLTILDVTMKAATDMAAIKEDPKTGEKTLASVMVDPSFISTQVVDKGVTDIAKNIQSKPEHAEDFRTMFELRDRLSPLDTFERLRGIENIPGGTFGPLEIGFFSNLEKLKSGSDSDLSKYEEITPILSNLDEASLTAKVRDIEGKKEIQSKEVNENGKYDEKDATK